MNEPLMTRLGWLIAVVGIGIGGLIWWAVLTGHLPAWVLLW